MNTLSPDPKAPYNARTISTIITLGTSDNMAKKRRQKSKPNLPQATLDRARRQAGAEPDEPTPTSEAAAANVTADPAPSRHRRPTVSNAQIERSRKRGELSNEMISDVLANPTRVVTEDEMREEYQHVLVDLRNMGILAAILIVLMIGAAFVLPTF